MTEDRWTTRNRRIYRLTLFVATGIPMLIRRVQLLCDLDDLTARRVVCAMVRKWELK